MSEFEKEIIERIQRTMLEQIGDCRYIDYHHGNKMNVPQNLVDKAWAQIDWDSVVTQINQKIQARICAVVVESMLTEIKTDTIKVLAIQGVREKIRAEAYPKIMEALGND